MIVFAPAVVLVNEHEVAGSVIVQLCEPSLTVIVPVGVPAPGEVTETLAATLYACPTTVAVPSAAALVMAVVVFALFTVCEAVPELALKFASPLYVAVIVFAPGDVLVRLQLVAGKVIVQVCEPSLTVTVPVGVPAAAVTLTLTAYVCPTTDGVEPSEAAFVIVVVVGVELTVCVAFAEALPL